MGAEVGFDIFALEEADQVGYGQSRVAIKAHDSWILDLQSNGEMNQSIAKRKTDVVPLATGESATKIWPDELEQPR